MSRPIEDTGDESVWDYITMMEDEFDESELITSAFLDEVEKVAPNIRDPRAEEVYFTDGEIEDMWNAAEKRGREELTAGAFFTEKTAGFDDVGKWEDAFFRSVEPDAVLSRLALKSIWQSAETEVILLHSKDKH